eukprot:1159157-Amphidinium_carterae.1
MCGLITTYDVYPGYFAHVPTKLSAQPSQSRIPGLWECPTAERLTVGLVIVPSSCCRTLTHADFTCMAQRIAPHVHSVACLKAIRFLQDTAILEHLPCESKCK